MVNFRAFVFYKQLLPSIIHNINGVDLDNFRLKIIAGQNSSKCYYGIFGKQKKTKTSDTYLKFISL